MTLEKENKKLREALLDAYEVMKWDMFYTGSASEDTNTFDHGCMGDARQLIHECGLKPDKFGHVKLDKLKERMKKLPQKWLDEVLSK